MASFSVRLPLVTAYFGAEQFHAEDIERLALDIHLAHVDDAFQAKHRADRCRGDAMLSRARFGNDALFAHAFCQQTLPQRIIDFVRACVCKVFTFEIDL